MNKFDLEIIDFVEMKINAYYFVCCWRDYMQEAYFQRGDDQHHSCNYGDYQEY